MKRGMRRPCSTARCDELGISLIEFRLPPARPLWYPWVNMGRDDFSYLDIVSDYVRKRLDEECDQWGKATHIAAAIGSTPVHIYNVRSGNRRVGEDFAGKIAAYWRMTRKQLLLQALADAGEIEQVQTEAVHDPLPNLTFTLAWCEPDYPKDFLKAYTELVSKAPRDLRRRQWLDDIDAQLRNWASGIALSPRVLEPEQSAVRPKVRVKGPAAAPAKTG